MQSLEERIGYSFRDRKLLETALTHSSYANEHLQQGSPCYERLEFLGDSVLGAFTADYLYRHEPELPEGEMTRIRAELVCEESLHRVAQKLELGKWMQLGKGEEQSHGRERPSILADMVEALIAAVYLDGGPEPAERLVREYILKHAEAVIAQQSRDSKTALQELIQRRPGSRIRYEQTGETGPDHDKRFFYAVYIDEVLAGEGAGRTKKEAEQAAAGNALKNRMHSVPDGKRK